MNIFIFFTFLTFSLAAKELKIYKFNVGGGDSQLIVFPSGYSILIDAGEPTGAKGEAGINGKYLEKRIQSILKKKYIDVFVLTHFHWDHSGGYKVGGIWYLIEKAGFSFGKFIHRNIGKYQGAKLTDCNKNTITWKYVGTMSEKGAQFVCYATSSVEKTKLSQIGQIAKRCSTTQINPPDENSQVKIIIRDALGLKDSNGKKLARNSMNEKVRVGENDFSICLRIKFGKFVYATCGDLSGKNKHSSNGNFNFHDVESSVAPMIGEVDVMHINHHGTTSATNKKWCDTLKPTVAVSSCGDDGYGIHKNGLKNLKNVGAKIYTTGLAKESKNKSDYKGVVRMNDDVVITVPVNGKKFTVSNSVGKKMKSFEIKQKKVKAEKCKGL